MMRGMVIDMNDEQLHTLAELQAFLDGTVTVDFAVAAEARYDFIARTVRRFGYLRLKRADKGVVLRFLERVSGYSRQQLTRLVKRGAERRSLIKRYRASRTSFARTYTSADVLLLAHTDTLHGTLSGLATKKLMERAYGVFGAARYERLAYHLGGASVQPAPAERLSAPAPGVDQDPAGHHCHRRTASASAEQPARLSAPGQRLPGRSGWRQRPLPHQCRGLRDAVRGRGYLRAY